MSGMARKWFQLVDENEISMTSTGSVCVDVEDVVTFREAVFAKVSRALAAHVTASDLQVLANGVALEADSSIESFGGANQDALIVRVPQAKAQRAVALDVRRNLDRVHVQFTTRDVNYLLDKETAKYSLLKSPVLTSEEALQIRESARAAIKSVTQNAIRIREGVQLDGPLNLSQGQSKSAFYYAYSSSGGILAAKVYGAMYREAFQREVAVNLALGSHKNVVQFLKSFSIENDDNEQRHIIVMPFFARSAADLLVLQSPVELGALITIAHDCFEALCHIHSKKYCFADLKPANIMLNCGEQGGATLVDFGAAVRLGEPLVEVTDPFCLDVGTVQGSVLLDWTCLGTTLAQLAGVDVTNFCSRWDLVQHLEDEHEQVDTLVAQLIVSCLQDPSEDRIKLSFDHLLLKHMPLFTS